MRLIDADALLIDMAKHTIITDDLYGMGIMAGVDSTIKTIIKQPTIDAVPAVHGRWETYTDVDEEWGDLDFSKCSICGNLHYDEYRYCPSCGAKMDAEEEPELIPILCKHASSAKNNEIGETVVYCEMCAAWQNVTLGDCYGNCECQEVCDDG